MKTRIKIKMRVYACLGLFLGLVWMRTVDAQPDVKADLVLFNGKIITVDPQDTIVQALAVKGDKIIRLGTNDALKPLIGPQTKVVNLQGRTATPGLIDSHNHVMYYGKQFWDGFLNIRAPEVKCKADLLRVIADKVLQTPSGEWISGNQGFTLQLGETLSRDDLDKAAPNNPLYLRHSSGQYVVVNTLALKLAGIDKNTPNPYGGRIVKDPATHEPTGLLLHYPAEALVARLAKGYGDRTEEELIEDVKRGQDICLSGGYTSIQDVIVALPRDISVYKKMADTNQLKIRLYALLYVDSEERAQTYAQKITPFKTDMVNFGGWKLAMDGGAQAGTLQMYDPNLLVSKSSYVYHTPETFNRIVSLLHKTGLQVAVHVGGDKGIDMTLDAFEAALKESPRANHRHRIEHNLFPTRQALQRTKNLGVVVSTHPQWITWYAAGYRQGVNEEIMQRFMPIKTMQNMGIPLAFGSDVPAALTHDPKWAFFGAITRKAKSGYTAGPEECISIRDALRIQTLGSAYAALEDNIKGSLEEGKLADIVVWSHDLYSIAPLQFNNLKALVTIVGGKVVYGQI